MINHVLVIVVRANHLFRNSTGFEATLGKFVGRSSATRGKSTWEDMSKFKDYVSGNVLSAVQILCLGFPSTLRGLS